VGVFAVDWERWTRAYPRAARGSRFAPFVPRAAATARSLDELPAGLRAERAGESVVHLLSEVLRVPAARLAPTQSLASLGLDSLMTVELRARILDTLGVDLAPSRILAATTVEALARDVASQLAAPTSSPAPTVTEAVPADDLTLADDLPIAPGDSAGAASDILLTGATGFVGAHVVRALLDDGRATLRCLVRAPDERKALDRVLASLRTYGALRDGDAARIVPVLGDLTLDGMGLSADQRGVLARDVDAIVHAGARVNHMFPYARLRDANVKGTLEVLRLAAEGRRKVVHHVSTMVVFPLATMAGQSVDEATPLPEQPEPFFAGYAASKWAAEHLCFAARGRGLDVRIHRPAQVTGSAAAALSPATDVLWRLVAAALTLGVVPELHSGVSLVPVDFVARAIAAVAFDPRQVNGTFHLMSRAAYPVASAVHVLRQMGYALRSVPAGEWIPLVERTTGTASPLAPDIARLHGVDLAALDAASVRCACDDTLARLPAELRALAAVDDALFARYVRELVTRGALPPPPRAARERPSHPPPA
jgi:thioester reductase-like protein